MATDDGRDILRLTRIYANHAVSGEDTNFGVVITPTTPWAPVMLVRFSIKGGGGWG